jgi:AcrR family transcriptional regulator
VTPTPRTTDVPGRIVHAAVALFSRQGYRGTTTQEIARLAEVSEVTVYRYYKHKEDIFWASLDSSFKTIKLRLDSLDAALKFQMPERAVPQILGLMVDTIVYSPELPRMVAVAFLEHGRKAEEICYEYLAPLFNTIAGYLEMNIAAGRIRKLNPAMVTAAIALMVVAHPEISMLVEGYKHKQMSSREAINDYSAFWLDVLEPTTRVRTPILVPDVEAQAI